MGSAPDSQRRYYELDPDKVQATISSLSLRIAERFPGSGLAGVARELVEIGKLARERMEWIGQPIWKVRALTYIVVALLLGGIALLLFNLKPQEGVFEFTTFVGVLESGLNDLVMLGIGIFFLVTLETRIKRKRALEAIHELRSIAHVIDMHQLTKDPDRLLRKADENTEHSPRSELTIFQLRRYLDYCAELLSLTGKIASLYLGHFGDSAAIAAVNEIEDLTTGLSRKIWQKIMILQGGGIADDEGSGEPEIDAN